MRLDCTVGAQRSALSAGWRRPSVHTDTFIHPRPLSTRAHDPPPSASDPRRRCLPLRVRDLIEHILRLFHEHFTSISRPFRHLQPSTLHWQPLATQPGARSDAASVSHPVASRRVPSPTFSTSLNLAHLAHLAPSPRRARTCLRRRVWTLALGPGPQRSAGSGSGSNARSDSLDSLAPSSPTPAPPAPPAHLLQLTYCLVLLETPGLPSEPHDDCLLCKVSLAVARCRSP